MGPMLGEMEYFSTASYGQAWYCGSAEQEARNLLPLLRVAGQTVADVLDLIGVAPEEERQLRAFAEKFPDLKLKVECLLDYRLRVEKEFCRSSGRDGCDVHNRSDAAYRLSLQRLRRLILRSGKLVAASSASRSFRPDARNGGQLTGSAQAVESS